MTDKTDHDDAARKREADKREKEAAEKHGKQPDVNIDNPNQDPGHPANRTLSPKSDPAPRPAAEGITVPPEQMMTAQESDQSGDVPGVGPVSPSEVSPGPVETIEDQGIGPRTPYPDGNPWVPPAEEAVVTKTAPPPAKPVHKAP